VQDYLVDVGVVGGGNLAAQVVPGDLDECIGEVLRGDLELLRPVVPGQVLVGAGGSVTRTTSHNTASTGILRSDIGTSYRDRAALVRVNVVAMATITAIF
jgi:hypothetical protein